MAGVDLLSDASSAALTQMPEFSGGKLPTLAPLVREVTPSVVNIAVRGRVKENNPRYRDPLFREFLEVPKELEREVQAVGSGVLVDAQHGYVLTANHVVAQAATVQVMTKDEHALRCKTRRPRPRHRCRSAPRAGSAVAKDYPNGR